MTIVVCRSNSRKSPQYPLYLPVITITLWAYGSGKIVIMDRNYDLHTHSTASDGTLSPGQLVREGAKSGVEVLALTDHDTTEGVAEAQEAAAVEGMELIPGVEISVSWNGYTVHILGLNIDPGNQMLQSGLSCLREFRDWRAEEIGRRLAKKRIPGAFAGASALSNGRLVSRTHFARFLVNAGYAKDVRSVFRHYLVQGKPGYVPGDWTDLESAVSWITHAGGLAVIAHPARYRMTRNKLRTLVGEFKEHGGRGIEVISGSHNRDECFTMARHAMDFDLLASAGSDFHDPENPWIALGKLPSLPTGCRPVWEQWGELQSAADVAC